MLKCDSGWGGRRRHGIRICCKFINTACKISHETRLALIIKCKVPNDQHTPSWVGLWKNAQSSMFVIFPRVKRPSLRLKDLPDDEESQEMYGSTSTIVWGAMEDSVG